MIPVNRSIHFLHFLFIGSEKDLSFNCIPLFLYSISHFYVYISDSRLLNVNGSGMVKNTSRWTLGNSVLMVLVLPHRSTLYLASVQSQQMVLFNTNESCSQHTYCIHVVTRLSTSHQTASSLLAQFPLKSNRLIKTLLWRYSKKCVIVAELESLSSSKLEWPTLCLFHSVFSIV